MNSCGKTRWATNIRRVSKDFDGGIIRRDEQISLLSSSFENESLEMSEMPDADHKQRSSPTGEEDPLISQNENGRYRGDQCLLDSSEAGKSEALSAQAKVIASSKMVTSLDPRPSTARGENSRSILIGEPTPPRKIPSESDATSDENGLAHSKNKTKPTFQRGSLTSSLLMSPFIEEDGDENQDLLLNGINF